MNQDFFILPSYCLHTYRRKTRQKIANDIMLKNVMEYYVLNYFSNTIINEAFYFIAEVAFDVFIDVKF